MEHFDAVKSTNLVVLDVIGPRKPVQIEIEADTGANITVLKLDTIQDLTWVEMQPTNVHIKGYDGLAKACFGKGMVFSNWVIGRLKKTHISASQLLQISSPGMDVCN